MISDFGAARSAELINIQGKYAARCTVRGCRWLVIAASFTNNNNEDYIYMYMCIQVYICIDSSWIESGLSWEGLKSASELSGSREMSPKLAKRLPRAAFCLSVLCVWMWVCLCLCACVCVPSRSVAHITNSYGQKMAFRSGHTHTHTASLLHNRLTHTHTHIEQIQVHNSTERWEGGREERMSGYCNTHTLSPTKRRTTELSSAQAQAQANNNNNNNDISRARAECATPPTKWLAGSAWGSSFCCSLCQIRLGFALSCSLALKFESATLCGFGAFAYFPDKCFKSRLEYIITYTYIHTCIYAHWCVCLACICVSNSPLTLLFAACYVTFYWHCCDSVVRNNTYACKNS